MAQERSAGAVIFRKENNEIYYLLLHYAGATPRAKDYWDLPKGHLEAGESDLDAAKREAFEETGLKDIEFIPGFRSGIKYFFRHKGRTVLKTVTFFLAETKQKEVKISDEHIGYEWLPFGPAYQKMRFLNAKNTLAKGRDFLISTNYHA
ncbi:MAG: NUDIX domain-containing protein [Candidatus Paceibacterota bacterium]|jgi:8-oxo-dGTP pyrophosphatase MutT (NUDIX family)